jgi:hypothetical protein
MASRTSWLECDSARPAVVVVVCCSTAGIAEGKLSSPWLGVGERRLRRRGFLMGGECGLAVEVTGDSSLVSLLGIPSTRKRDCVTLRSFPN